MECHIIKFGDVKNTPEYQGRIANRNNLQGYLDLGYRIVQVPVMVDNRASFNQETEPTTTDLDYLIETPQKEYDARKNPKALESLIKKEVSSAVRAFVKKTSVWEFFRIKLFKGEFKSKIRSIGY